MTNEEFRQAVMEGSNISVSKTEMYTPALGWTITWCAVVVVPFHSGTDNYCKYGDTRQEAIDAVLLEMRMLGVIK